MSMLDKKYQKYHEDGNWRTRAISISATIQSIYKNQLNSYLSYSSFKYNPGLAEKLNTLKKSLSIIIKRWMKIK